MRNFSKYQWLACRDISIMLVGKLRKTYCHCSFVRNLSDDKAIVLSQEIVCYFQWIGVKGIVRDYKGKPLGGATISVTDRDKVSKTTSHGEYWRLLLPGTYLFKVYIV